MTRLAAACLLLILTGTWLGAQGHVSGSPDSAVRNQANDFQVIELRRYTVRKGERQHFAEYFEAYFPEAMQQLGAIVAGEFLEREHTDGFTWIRGFHNMDQRALANAGLYYGPVWKEHKATMNNLMTDSDNVLLLRPLTPDRSVTVLPSVDPVKKTIGAKGVVVAQIFAVKPNRVEELAQQAETAFASYRSAGLREAGVLVTLDVANNFPQLPVRQDGPFLVWLGIAKDDDMVERKFRPLADEALRALTATDLLRGAPELIVMDPAPRSRMRWLAEWEQAGNRPQSSTLNSWLHL
jgi:hypothetical protein